MKELLKKYSILLISALVFSRLLSGIILIIWPDLLTTKLPQGGTSTLGIGYLTAGIDYLINVIFIFLLAKEMNRVNIKCIPLLVLTFFSSLLGLIFFFFIVAHQKLNLNISSTYD